MATKKKVVPVTAEVQTPPREILYEESQSYADCALPREVLVFEIEALVQNACSSNSEAVSKLREAIEDYLDENRFDDQTNNPGKLFIERFKVALIKREKVSPD